MSLAVFRAEHYLYVCQVFRAEHGPQAPARYFRVVTVPSQLAIVVDMPVPAAPQSTILAVSDYPQQAPACQSRLTLLFFFTRVRG